MSHAIFIVPSIFEPRRKENNVEDPAHNVSPIRTDTHVIQKRVLATVGERESYTRSRTFAYHTLRGF